MGSPQILICGESGGIERFQLAKRVLCASIAEHECVCSQPTGLTRSNPLMITRKSPSSPRWAFVFYTLYHTVFTFPASTSYILHQISECGSFTISHCHASMCTDYLFYLNSPKLPLGFFQLYWYKYQNILSFSCSCHNFSLPLPHYLKYKM